MTEKEQVLKDSDMSQPLAEAVVACLALRDLIRIRQLYPSAMSASDAEELCSPITGHLSMALTDSCFDRIRENLYREPKLDDPETDAELSGLFFALLMQCPGIQLSNKDADAMGESVHQVVAACQEKVSSPLKEIVRQLVEIKLYDCRCPEADPHLADPRRSLQRLQSYWALCRAIILNQIDALIGFQPHPLLRLIVNLRSRMDIYLGRLTGNEGIEQATGAVECLLDIVTSGEPDDLSAVPEWTYEQVHLVDAFLESARLKNGSRAFPLTHEEKIFIAHAEQAIAQYHQHVRVTGARMLDKASKMGAEQRKASEERNSQSVSFPTPAGASWTEISMKFIDGHTVSVCARDVRGRFNYTQMKMVDRRNGNPTKQWELLRDFAEHHGFLNWANPKADRRNQKRREILATNLRQFFRIKGDPIELTEDSKGWRVLFSLHPES